MANTALLTALGALGAGYGGYAKQLEEAEQKRVGEEDRKMRQSELDRAFNLRLDELRESINARMGRENISREELALQERTANSANVANALSSLIREGMVSPTGNLPNMFGIGFAPQPSEFRRSIDDLVNQGFSPAEANGLVSGRISPEDAMAMRRARGARAPNRPLGDSPFFNPFSPMSGDTSFISRGISGLPR